MLRGRVHECAQFAEILDTAVNSNRGEIVSLVGPAGIGKTALIAAIRASGTALNFQVVEVTSREELCPAAFASLLVGGEQRNVTSVDDLRPLLEHRLDRRPVLVIVDSPCVDNTMRARALTMLSVVAPHRPLVCVVARRPTSLQPSVEPWLHGAGFTVELELGPLSNQDAAALLGDTLGAVPSGWLTALAECAQGHPATIVELASAVAEEVTRCEEVVSRIIDLETSGNFTSFSGSSVTLPKRLGNILCRTLDGMSPSTRQVLDVAAVLGRSFLPDDVAEMLGLTVATLLAAFKEAFACGVLDSTPHGMRFRHCLVRQAMLQDLPEAVRGALHRQASSMLLRRGGSIVDAACHLACGALRGDPDTIGLLRRAAAKQLKTDPRIAGELALRGLELLGSLEVESCLELTEIAVEACGRSGPVSRTVELAENLLDRTLPESARIELEYWFATALLLSDRHAEADEVADRVLANPVTPQEMRSSLAVNRRLFTFLRQDLVVPRSSPTWCEADRLVLSAMMSWQNGNLSDALNDCRKALGVSDADSPVNWLCHPRVALAFVETHLRDFDAALATITELEAVVSEVLSAVPHFLRARIELDMGRVTSAVAEATAGLEIARRTGVHLLLDQALIVLTIAELSGEDLGEDQRREQLAAWARDTIADDNSLPLRLVDAFAAADRGDETMLVDLLTTVAGDAGMRRGLFVSCAFAVTFMVRSAVALNRPSWATIAVQSAEELALNNPEVRSVVATAAHARGLMEQNASLLERAAAEYPSEWLRAVALEDLGVLLMRDDRDDGVRHLETSISLFQSCRAEPDASRVRARLRAAGVVQRRWRRQAGPVAGVASLTDTERTVATLVVSGLTNQQVARKMWISHHTVAFHLRKIFRKLGVNARIELARHLNP